MSVMMIKEAAKAAQELSRPSCMLRFLVDPKGIMAQATNGKYEQNFLVSWEQLITANSNPLLAALSIVTATFQKELVDEG